jgi:hypothetical protein
MRARLCLAALCAVAFGSACAHAQTGPVIVVPGKPGVPVIINGVVADGAVVYGDWGLARPGHGQILIEGPVAFTASWDARGYFPATGRAPRYGRYEIEPPAPRRPRANTSFHRDWAIESDPRVPVTQYPPFDPPPVILAPRPRRR